MTAPSRIFVPLDVDKIRQDFPILEEQPYGKPLVYLDNAASAQKPKAVINSILDVVEHNYANVHRGLHYLSNQATDKFEAAREQVSTFLNAGHSQNIIFTAGATDAINMVASSYLEPRIKPGDEIILSVLEHHANIVPWHFLRERYGAVLKWVPLDESGFFDVDAYRAAFTDRTVFVALSHMSNVLGYEMPVQEIMHSAQAHGVPVLLDGCQGAVHLTPDVQKLGCDFYVMSGHKLYGPTGIGVLFGKPERLAEMRPYRGGGEMIEEVHEDRVSYAGLPHRLEAGTPAIIEAIALGAALSYMSQYDPAAVLAHENALGARAREALAQIPKVKLTDTSKRSGPIVSFTVEGAHAHDVSALLDRYGVAVRAGHHCAQPLMRRLGVSATARASFAIYNTMDEVDVLAQSLEKAIRFFD